MQISGENFQIFDRKYQFWDLNHVLSIISILMLRYQARLEHRTFPINISHQKWSNYIKIYGFSGEYLLKNGIL